MWVLPSKASKTKVEPTEFISKEYYPSSVLAILKIVSFLKWTGCLPVVVTSLSAGFLRIEFAGLHITTVIWILAITLHISLTIDYVTHHALKNTSDALVAVLFVGSLICSKILIPRMGLARKTALESALNTVTEIHESLRSNFTSSKLWLVTFLVIILEFLAIIFTIIRVYFIREESQVFGSPIFTLGTGIPLIGNIVFEFLSAFYCISTWMLPIQLFMFSHTLASYYQDFADKIRLDLYPHLSCSYRVDILEKSLTHNVGHLHELRNRLRKLQTTSSLLEKAVSDVNAYFGLALLLYLVCHLLQILDNLYYVSKFALKVRFENTGKSIFLANATLMLILHSAELLFMLWAADLIPTAVNRCKEIVGGIPFCDGNFKDEHGSLDVQLQSFHSRITANKVGISAFGLFTISRKIIPSVFGTIITYYLILLQYGPDQGRTGQLVAVNMKNSSE